MAGVETEVFVVDNNSVDGSVEMVREKFPWVHCIANKGNAGFSKANNQAIRISKGEYVILLNPDTVVEEDTFEKCVRFMDEHPDAGGLGVQMIDGKGNFLPESKRGLPSPAVAFYKIFGLSALFPKSKTFGRYHLGYLDKDKTHEVEILAGAFMMMRRTALDKTGLLDETFFMYGEDIDLSYRILKAGYKNYYFPGTRIIHYKGESTKKSSVNYVIVFYKAMIIFAAKHFSGGHARTFSFLINIAIYLRAGLAILQRIVKKLALPVTDAALFFGGMYFLKLYWESSVKELHYPPIFLWVVVPVYILVWISAIFLSGGYDKPIRLSRLVRGILSGTVFILVVYALLSEEYRFSRALILLGTAWASLSSVALRYLLDWSGIRGFELERSDKKHLVIVGGAEEGRRILGLLQLAGTPVSFIGFVSPGGKVNDPVDAYGGFHLGTIQMLDEITRWYNVHEVIFCSRDISSQDIIAQMLLLSRQDVEYKIAPSGGRFIIGSNSIDDQGDLYLADVNAVTTRANRRNKRLLDVVVSMACLPVFPFLLFLVQHKVGLLSNVFFVLSGKRSWVGLIQTGNLQGELKLKPGVLNPADGLHLATPDTQTLARLNALYARDYKVWKDVRIITRSIRFLGRDSSS